MKYQQAVFFVPPMDCPIQWLLMHLPALTVKQGAIIPRPTLMGLSLEVVHS